MQPTIGVTSLRKLVQLQRENPGGPNARKRFFQMSQKQHTVDQIIAKLRRADVLLGKGTKVSELCKQLDISEQTYYRWRQKYGGMQPKMAKTPKPYRKRMLG